MLPLLTAQQIREADAYTIAHEPISSVNLMERASKAFVSWFVNHFPDKRDTISVYCGTGNNGGDGLAIARLLFEHDYRRINVKIARYTARSTADFDVNLQRLQAMQIPLIELSESETLPQENADILIDALLGSGLNKPLDGSFRALVDHLNSLSKCVVAVDVPTGFYTDGEVELEGAALKSNLVITFQQAKINFLLPESGAYINCWEAVNIGLDTEFISSLQSPYQMVEDKDIHGILKPRTRFSHKGTFGHSLIIAGQAKTMGAALLSSSACVYAGAGLTTACVPEAGLTALNSYQAEVMAIVRNEYQLPDLELEKFKAIAIGPGLGTGDDALALLQHVITDYQKPLVIDADGLNLLAGNTILVNQLPAKSIITPHMKEFDRLFGHHTSWWQRLQTMWQKASELNIYIVLKNSYTITGTPEGQLYFNSSSNAAMAVGGMGDVLTGVITALLAQGYSPLEACLAGVYLHGRAGDELALPDKLNVVLPGQVAARVPATMAKLTQK
ncbi:NAD(P)H-hydrate dehydratase [Mucilaginibacter aquatilis]|uniref:Bifunctional NAD(P)H-hydrate repair enzyme n=1 Tax=Mucilaginibacter aquatilis TaxID=1517760 RepID=A0A6I4I6X2_9SPHI|nr:NAD(P)H-hydrate dehydratase [Mucilaginibacter aquatilis]MVN90832.1 NAD(P)H-hydrate dehydratase [Mucilaginibacter aquatilis]